MDQAEGDSELVTYLSGQQHKSANREDLETAVWGAHTHTHSRTHTQRVWTLSSWRQPCDKKVLNTRNRASHRSKRWPEESTDSLFNGQLFICIYLFIFYLLVVPVDGWLIVGLLTVQAASALWGGGENTFVLISSVYSQVLRKIFQIWSVYFRTAENIKPVCQRHSVISVSHKLSNLQLLQTKLSSGLQSHF